MDTLIMIATKIFFLGIVGLFSIRLLGKHTLSEITPFLEQYRRNSIMNIILLYTSKILQKTDSISQTIEGEPELLIDQGKL